jgi:polyisoprenoid-binding protein YceI
MASTRLAAGDPPGVDAGVAPQASASAAVPVEVPYRIDARRSQFFVQAEAGGVLAAFAHDHKMQVRDFSGTVRSTAKGLQFAALDLTIVADSLSLVDKVSEGDRKEIEGSMKEKVLETAKFPKIVFRSISVTVDSTNNGNSNLKVVGNLWLHGVGHKITIPVTVALKGDSLRATGTTKLRQTDYGMEPYTAAVGTIRVKDEVTLSFDIVATRP